MELEERELNVKNCFDIVKGLNVVGKNILLVDDLMTSGSTLKYASRQLLKAGASSIVIAVACRVV